jgi:hypothetical protein
MLCPDRYQFRSHETDKGVIHEWEWPPPTQVPQIWSYNSPSVPKPEGPEIMSEMLMDHWWNGHSMSLVEVESQITGNKSRPWYLCTIRVLRERFRGASTIPASGGQQKNVCIPHWAFDSTPKKVNRKFELLETHRAPLKGWGIYVEEGFKISWEISVFFLVAALCAIGIAGGLAKKTIIWHTLGLLACHCLYWDMFLQYM